MASEDRSGEEDGSVQRLDLAGHLAKVLLAGHGIGALPDPQPVAVRIVDAKLGHAVERPFQVGDVEAVAAHLRVELGDVVRVESRGRLDVANQGPY